MENFCKTCKEPIPLMGKTGRKRAFCSESCKLFYTNHVKKFNSLECLRDASTVNDDLDIRKWAKKWCLDKKKAFRRKILEPRFIKAAGIESIALPLIDMINEHPTNEFLSKQSEKFNAWLNNSTRSICPVCNNKYPTFNQTVWRVYCSEKCCNIAKRSGGNIRETIDTVFIEKYGVKGGFTKERLEQFADDYESKHGVRNSMQRGVTIQKSMTTRKANGFDKFSQPELDIKNYIESLGFKCEHSNWSLLCGKEIDLYVHEKKLAIEFNGCYFHSEANGGEDFARNRHIEKTELCESKGVQLLHIWEDEWHNDRQKVLKMIRAKLGANKDSIYARKTKVVMSCNPIDLLEENHIQGNGQGSIKLGLEYNDVLVAAMCFIKSPEMGVWELNRFVGLNVVGGFSKLLKAFMRNYEWKSIISFGDRCVVYRYDNLYTKNGFKEVSINKPDYKYTKGAKDRSHKFNFRKQILSKKHGFDLSMSEHEMATELGFYRIYNAGLIKYELKKALL